LGADFRRFGLDLLTEVKAEHARNARRLALLDEMNQWRNAIAHQDFDPSKLGGRKVLRLVHVQRWRSICGRLALSIDKVTYRHLLQLTGTPPW